MFLDFLPCHNIWFNCFIVLTSKYACNKTVSWFFFSISVFLVLIQLFRFQFLIQFNFYSASTLLCKPCFVFFYSVPWEMLYVLRWKVCRFLFVYSFLLISFNDMVAIDKNLLYMVYYFDTIFKLSVSLLNILSTASRVLICFGGFWVFFKERFVLCFILRCNILHNSSIVLY